MPLSRTQLQSPTFLKSLLASQRQVRATLSDVTDTNIHSTSSFFYDRPGEGIKSTQQLNVDWSKFENHTFFNSAEVNVNVAFDKIINRFPFDGTKQDYERFFESLTGFEKWIYDRFPKNVGYLNFSGSSQVGAGMGTYVRVSGLAGSDYPDLAVDKSGVNILDPGQRSFSIECQLYIPSQSNGTEIVYQKTDGQSNGFTLALLSTSSWSHTTALFAVVSGSNYLTARATVRKGQFNHICATLDRNPRKNKAYVYVDSVLQDESTTSYALGPLGSDAAPLYIGSGSAFRADSTYTPTETLSGSIDEFRFFHEARTAEQQKAYAKKSIFASDGLKLYFKFNEPSGTLLNSNTESDSGILIDSSGNELHSAVQNFSYALRSTGTIDPPLIYEKLALSPVLFPAFTDTLALNTVLLTSASEYDDNNKNLITRLIPPHYLEDGKAFYGLSTVEGTIGDSYSDGTVPGTGKLGAAQLMASFLYVWAKFFDELKLYVDAFATLKHVDYSLPNTTPDSFLPFLLKHYGFQVPNFFNDSSIEQFIDAENIQPEFGTNEHALQYVQNQIHRRVLVNLLDILKSKGTLHSVKSFIRALGIDPDNSFRIREFGGVSRRNIQTAREEKTEPHFLLDMYHASGTVKSPFMSSSRTEVGFPEPVGTMVNKVAYPPHGISNVPNDGLWLSGSWTYEALYRYPMGRAELLNSTQSLARFAVTGTGYGSHTDRHGTFVNLVATSGSLYDTPAVRLYVRSDVSTMRAMRLEVTGSDIFDGNKWNISFGRQRSDEFESAVSSSYFLKVARSDAGEVLESYTTQSYYQETNDASGDHIMNAIDASLNASGAFLVFGGETAMGAGTLGGGYYFLNSTDYADTEARTVSLQGQVGMVRFYSRAVTDDEWLEHVRNYKSTGVSNPHVNWNHGGVQTGSFERLRLDVPMEQEDTTTTSGGTLNFFDYSQGNMHLTGTGFPASTRVLKTDIFRYGMFSPLFDEASTSDKVRVRGFQSYDNVVKYPHSSVAPNFGPEPSEPPTDDTRFSIEFSLVDALNRDIVNIFGTLDELDNALGSPELLFSYDYPDLEHLRTVYFNRLTEKMNFQTFFEYFKWFDSSISAFILQLIPRKSRFYGTNFVVESHMLERAKMQYHHYENYLGVQNRIASSRDIRLQLFAAALRKF